MRKELDDKIIDSEGAFKEASFLLLKKYDALSALIDNQITLLTEGGYKGRRDDLLKVLNRFRNEVSKAKAQFTLLKLQADYSVAFEAQVTTFLTIIHTFAKLLLKQLRVGNCNPQSTTQPLRQLLCQLLNVPAELQLPILTEISARQLDETLEQSLSSFSDKSREGTVFFKTVLTESRLIVITPKEASLLPENFHHDSDFFRLSAHGIAWWRLNHHAVSTLQAGSFFDRVKAPGGLSALMAQLIESVNRATKASIKDTLRNLIQALPDSPPSKELTHSMRVIRSLKENLHDYTWCVDPEITRSPCMTVSSLNPILRVYAVDTYLSSIVKNHNGGHALLQLSDALQLLKHFKMRWEKYSKTNPTIYLQDDASLSALDRSYLTIAAAVARQLSFAHQQFKMPLGLLMPGSVYDQLIEAKYRQYPICDRLARMLSLGEQDDRTIDVIAEIAPPSLLFTSGVPISSHWYVVAAAFESLATPHNDTFTLHHPISDQPLKQEECEQLTQYGEVGMETYLKTVMPDPSKRSLQALVKFLHAMVLNNGNTFYYSGLAESRLHIAYSTFLETIESFTKIEQLKFWNTPIPGLATRATIQSTLKRSLANDENACTHMTGTLLALVIHQYFQNADDLLPNDAKRQKFAISGKFKTEFQYIDQNRRTPASNDRFEKDVMMPDTETVAMP